MEISDAKVLNPESNQQNEKLLLKFIFSPLRLLNRLKPVYRVLVAATLVFGFAYWDIIDQWIYFIDQHQGFVVKLFSSRYLVSLIHIGIVAVISTVWFLFVSSSIKHKKSKALQKQIDKKLEDARSLAERFKEKAQQSGLHLDFSLNISEETKSKILRSVGPIRFSLIFVAWYFLLFVIFVKATPGIWYGDLKWYETFFTTIMKLFGLSLFGMLLSWDILMADMRGVIPEAKRAVVKLWKIRLNLTIPEGKVYLPFWWMWELILHPEKWFPETTKKLHGYIAGEEVQTMIFDRYVEQKFGEQNPVNLNIQKFRKGLIKTEVVVFWEGIIVNDNSVINYKDGLEGLIKAINESLNRFVTEYLPGFNLMETMLNPQSFSKVLHLLALDFAIGHGVYIQRLGLSEFSPVDERIQKVLGESLAEMIEAVSDRVNANTTLEIGTAFAGATGDANTGMNMGLSHQGHKTVRMENLFDLSPEALKAIIEALQDRRN